jgi:hypothetical protein
MALGSTQPLTEMSTGVFPGSKNSWCVRLITVHHPGPLSCNLGTLNSWNSSGHLRPVMGLIYLYWNYIFFCMLSCIIVYYEYSLWVSMVCLILMLNKSVICMLSINMFPRVKSD